MSKLEISKRDGMVELPNGELIRSDLSHEEFRTSAVYLNSRILHAGAGVTNYQFAAGQVHEKRWRARLSFFNQLLLHLDLRANLYPADWKTEEKNLDVELETKAFHQRILSEMLGQPEIVDDLEKFRAYELSGHYLSLAQQAIWKFPWGVVASRHSFSEGATSLRVTYATRPQRAMKKFVSRRKR